MEGNHLNVTRALVRMLLLFTAEQRQTTTNQSNCQLVQCIFSMNMPDLLNESCLVRSEDDEDFMLNSSQFVSIAQIIRLYFYPLFIFMGIFGNSLSCLTMFVNIRRNGYPANFYLSLLAFVDCLFLLGSGLPDWMSHIHIKLDIRLILPLLGCRLVYWFGNFTTHLSAGLVVSVTIERFIAIRYPFVNHKANSLRQTRIALIILIIFLFLLDSRILVFVGNFHDNAHTMLICSNETMIKYERRDLFRCVTTNESIEDTWVLIDFAVYTLIPFLIIVTLNSLIISRLIASQRLRQMNTQSKIRTLPSSTIERTRQNDVQRLRRTRSVPLRGIIRSEMIEQERQLRSSLKKNSLSTDLTFDAGEKSSELVATTVEISSLRSSTTINNTRLTILLLSVSFSYFVLTLPAVAINLMLTKIFKSHPTRWNQLIDERHPEAVLYYTVARLLMIINHSINFILYFVVGKRFRQDLKRLFFH